MNQYLVSYQWSQTETENILVTANSSSEAKQKVENYCKGGYGASGVRKVDKTI